MQKFAKDVEAWEPKGIENASDGKSIEKLTVNPSLVYKLIHIFQLRVAREGFYTCGIIYWRAYCRSYNQHYYQYAAINQY